MRLLVVEDDKALRESLVEQLKHAGFNVDAAADGEEGLYCGREYALDLAIAVTIARIYEILGGRHIRDECRLREHQEQNGDQA